MFIGHLLYTRDHAKLFSVLSFKPPPHTHMADTIIIPTVQMKKDAKPLLWTLMGKNLWHLSSFRSIYMGLTHIN